jgi:aromatic amino acid aminotransferase I
MTKDLSHLLSLEAKARSNSLLKTIAQYKQPDIAFLASGLPLPEYFAWESICLKTRKPPFEDGLKAFSNEFNELVIDVGHNLPISSGLQYAAAIGPKPLVEFIKEHTRIVHKDIANDEWDLILTAGSTHAWEAVLRTFTDRGDSILVEKYAFASALETARPKGLNLVAMDIDSYGIIPKALENKLKNWEKGVKYPKLIYTVPTGQNPTGSTIPEKRRKLIYEIASKYDIIIVEDEPYYFLQLDDYVAKSKRSFSSRRPSNEEFLASLVPSFLTFDVDGRVIRLDSFSKILAPGTRIGSIIAQKSFIERFARDFETTIQNPSGFASLILYETLECWGQDGYFQWLKALREEYSNKRNVAIDTALSALGDKKFVTVNIPNAGMFFTISIDAAAHPHFTQRYNEDPLALEDEIYRTNIANKSVLVPGSWFEVVQDREKRSSLIIFRGTFAATDEETLAEGIERFAQTLNQIFE